MDRVEKLINNIYKSLQNLKKENENRYATLSDFDNSLQMNISKLQKLDTKTYECYREQIIKTIKENKLDDKEKIIIILENLVKECFSG